MIDNTPSLTESIQWIVMTLRIFYIMAFIGVVVNIFFWFFLFTYFDCEDKTYGNNWYITLGIDTFMCYLNVVMGMFLFWKRDNQSDEGFNVSRKDYSRIKLQMWILIYGYAIASTLTLLWFVSFPFIFEDKDLEWPSEHYWVPNDEEAGALAFAKSVLLIFPTFVLWLTFFYFRIPRINNENIKFKQQGNEESSNTLNYAVAPGQLMTTNQANAYTVIDKKKDSNHKTIFL